MEAPTYGPLLCAILLIGQIRCQVVSCLEIDRLFNTPAREFIFNPSKLRITNSTEVKTDSIHLPSSFLPFVSSYHISLTYYHTGFRIHTVLIRSVLSLRYNEGAKNCMILLLLLQLESYM